jgi:hypothetical protein
MSKMFVVEIRGTSLREAKRGAKVRAKQTFRQCCPDREVR